MTGKKRSQSVLKTAACSVLGLIIGTTGIAESSNAQTTAANKSALQMSSTLLPNGIQQIVVLYPERFSIAVYQIDPTSGKLQLKSVRDIRLDLEMEEYNAQEPLPSELRKVAN